MPEIDLQHASLADLVAGCDIDHSIGPVVDTQGGTAAGYARWQRFRQQQLSRYASLRNNPLVDGVSRLSAYLHYGMISPMRIAREAAQQATAGSQKFLDELLIWRELAYAFCFYRPDHGRWSALPDWARQSLQAHRNDKRPALYTWEQLARGQTHDELWNSAQQSLLKHGELHNNLRMTWGKAILNWQATPQQALRTIVDLNHRFALDGRDPASYGGILWCLGQFDRPFEPEQAVLGSVRPRPTTSHAQRLDSVAYASKIGRPRCAIVPRVAVVGAGMSGLIAARTLCDSGMKVTVFEKSGGVGGRMATRQLNGQSAFDHGAQYFTVRDARFRRYVDSWIEQGLVSCWPADFHSQAGVVVLRDGVLQADSNSVDRFVGVPGMNSVCQHLAQGLELRLQTRASRVQLRQGELTLFAEQGPSLGSFEQLVLAIPAPQALPMIEQSPELVAAIANINMHPCWAVMATFEQPLTNAWVGAFLHDSFLSWAARNHTKPGRNPAAEQFGHPCPQHMEPRESGSRSTADCARNAARILASVRT